MSMLSVTPPNYIASINGYLGGIGDLLTVAKSDHILVNNSHKTIHFKPGNIGDGVENCSNWGTFRLALGDQTTIPIDAVNVDGVVYKVYNGYFCIAVEDDNFEVISAWDPRLAVACNSLCS